MRLNERLETLEKVRRGRFPNYFEAMPSFADPLEATSGGLGALQKVLVPDLWQQQAVSGLREGKDVVVHAPTGSGKTLIFELWSNQGKNRGQAIYTVPTRALANDKLAEWRGRGWNVGIATGDLSENLSAPILVATLETQKQRLIQGDGPALLVVDEYQMLGDDDRGLNYELALALAPEKTRLLLLSGSVANPHHIVQWLNRLGRTATLVRHEIRPVPLDEVLISQLSWQMPREIRSYWSKFCAKGLAENLGPILLFAPRRQQAEQIAAELARELPCPFPLQLSEDQRVLVGDSLAKMLKARVAYHHSGLSYGARAGVIEPLAKAGQLRVVVATMGLAAGINFSLRSVALTAGTYRRDGQETPIRPDEILQMFGRAGRRGMDESGYVLISNNEIRMRDGHAAHLSRSKMVDWSALLSLMSEAAAQGKDPYREAVRVQERLFTTKPIFLGVEHSLKHPDAPCGLKTDSERARHVRHRVREMRNSKGEWQKYPLWEERPWDEVRIPFQPKSTSPPRLIPALSNSQALEKVGTGDLVVLQETETEKIYGRESTVADRVGDDRVVLAKWVQRLTGWNGRQASLALWRSAIEVLLTDKMKAQQLPVVGYVEEPHRIRLRMSLAEQLVKVPVDDHGVPLWRPMEREVLPKECLDCSYQAQCKALPTTTGTALLWRRLLLVDGEGVPTLRGRLVSFFSGGDGLAVAAALEESRYPIDELVYDLANLDAGFRFCSDDSRWGGRLAMTCREKYANQSIPGYLENGMPPKYGSGAETVVRSIYQDPHCRDRFTSAVAGDGDIDRVIIEWRSLLRQVAHAPTLDWPRWKELQTAARKILDGTESPTVIDLPPLGYLQTKRMDHRLNLRRY